MYACTGFNDFFACFSLQTKSKYVHLFCAAGFFRFLQKACGFFCQRNASVDLIDVMLVQPNVLQQDGRIPAPPPLECYNKFPPLENIRTSKCPNYARGGCYTFVLIGALVQRSCSVTFFWAQAVSKKKDRGC